MAFVAVDLDNTLGYFEHLVPIGEFFFGATGHLAGRVARAEARFFASVAERQHLVTTILRPNLDAMMRPILAARRVGKLRAMVIYSNSTSGFCLRLAKTLIEDRYDTPLFCALIDATDPIRKSDVKVIKHGEPLKTLGVLRKAFKIYCGIQQPIHANQVIFIDERPVRHDIAMDEKDGLTYIQPTPYRPTVPLSHKKELFGLLMQALVEEELLGDPEYLDSPVFHCLKQSWYTRRRRVITNIRDLMEFADEEMARAGHGEPFKADTRALRQQLLRGLGRY